jgi:hypothetical protein
VNVNRPSLPAAATDGRTPVYAKRVRQDPLDAKTGRHLPQWTFMAIGKALEGYEHSGR